jgi:hypothetical protein
MHSTIEEELTTSSATVPIASARIPNDTIWVCPVSNSEPFGLEQISLVGQDDCELEQIFYPLVKSWKDATGGYSVTTRRYEHPSYLAIRTLGYDAVPLILQELQQRPDWWFEALKGLTGENPVKPNSTFEEAVNAWIEWGRQHNLIP